MTDAKRREAADYLVSLAMHYLNIGKYQEAVVKFHQALRLYKTLNGYYHYCVAATWNSIGNAHQLLKRYEEALTSYNEALRILKIVHGEVHADVALCFHNISELYQRVGFTEVAARIRDQSMCMREELFLRAPSSSSLKAESFADSMSTVTNDNGSSSCSANLHSTVGTRIGSKQTSVSKLGLGHGNPASNNNNNTTRAFPYSNTVNRQSLPASAGTSCVIS